MNRSFRAPSSLLPVILAGIMLAILSGCHTHKESASTSPDAANAVMGYDAMVETYKPWQRIRVPFTLKLLAPKNFSISGTATFERGSSIHMSMRMLGMEVAVLQFTPDSLIFAEKMNKQYLSIPVAKALGGLDASIDNVEDLLTGRAFLLGADSLTLAMRNLFTIGRNRAGRPWALTPRRQPHNAIYGFTISPTGAVDNLSVETDGGISANAAYTSAPVTGGHGAFASSITISTKLKEKDLQIMVEWDFSRARWDTDVEAKNLSIGRGYRKLSVENLMKALPDSPVK